MSSRVRPAASTAGGIAAAGPTPIIDGGTPTAAKLLNTRSTGRPRLIASLRVISMTAAAPSVICDEFPAVVVPPFLKTGLNLPSIATLVPGLIPSSSEITTFFSSSVFGSLRIVCTGTISSRKFPAARAAAAFACDLAANVS
eukprot:jgi/Picsp_1/2072/NSC_05537-R1_hypothetical protein CaO19.1705 [Candida albicans SC5314]